MIRIRSPQVVRRQTWKSPWSLEGDRISFSVSSVCGRDTVWRTSKQRPNCLCLDIYSQRFKADTNLAVLAATGGGGTSREQAWLWVSPEKRENIKAPSFLCRRMENLENLLSCGPGPPWGQDRQECRVIQAQVGSFPVNVLRKHAHELCTASLGVPVLGQTMGFGP